MTPTPQARIASLILGRDVITLINELRADGKPWDEIRQHICDATNGEIDVTRQAIQGWHVMAQTRDSA